MITNVKHLTNDQFRALIKSKGFCEICGISQTHPNYAYHVCVRGLYKDLDPLDTKPDDDLLYS